MSALVAKAGRSGFRFSSILNEEDCLEQEAYDLIKS
jgi:hypothetical protein